MYCTCDKELLGNGWNFPAVITVDVCDKSVRRWGATRMDPANQPPHRTARLVVEPGPGPGPSTVGRQADKVYFHRREEGGARGAVRSSPGPAGTSVTVLTLASLTCC